MPNSQLYVAAIGSPEFFVSNIRNPHTRRAYGRSIAEFLAWCEHNGLASTRTTQLYDRRRDEMSLDEVERVVI